MTDGRRFVGTWKNGRQHGDGQIVSKDKTVQHGEWAAGKVVRWYENKDQQPNGVAAQGPADPNSYNISLK